MTVTAVGRDALVRVFSSDYNLKSLLPFIELTGNGYYTKQYCI